MIARYHNYEDDENYPSGHTPALTLKDIVSAGATFEPENTEKEPIAYGELSALIKILFSSGTSEKNKIWVDFGNSKFEEASLNKMEFAIVKENEIIAIPNFDASYFIISTGNLSNNVQIKMIEILYEK